MKRIPEMAKSQIAQNPNGEGGYVPFFFGHDWIGEYLASDIEELAKELRQAASFLEGKASLLREQMLLASGESAAARDELAQQAQALDMGY